MIHKQTRQRGSERKEQHSWAKHQQSHQLPIVPYCLISRVKVPFMLRVAAPKKRGGGGGTLADEVQSMVYSNNTAIPLSSANDLQGLSADTSERLDDSPSGRYSLLGPLIQCRESYHDGFYCVKAMAEHIKEPQTPEQGSQSSVPGRPQRIVEYRTRDTTQSTQVRGD